MLRVTIRADENTDVEAEVSRLREQVDGARLDPLVAAPIITQASVILRELVSRCRSLTSMGSQFRARREISGPGYSVLLEVGPASTRSFFQKLLDAFRGR